MLQAPSFAELEGNSSMFSVDASMFQELFGSQLGGAYLGDKTSKELQPFHIQDNINGSSGSAASPGDAWALHSPSPSPTVSDELMAPGSGSGSGSLLKELLDDPEAALLVSARVRQRKAVASQSHSAAAKPRAVNCKRTRAREKDKLDSLEVQVAEIQQQVNNLTLVNEQLHLKDKVLRMLMQCLEQLEAKAASTPCQSSSGSEATTPAKFIAAYKRNLSESSKWVLQADCGLTSDIEQQLQACNQIALDSVYLLCIQHPHMMAHVKAELLKQFPLGIPEEEHWFSVIRALELTPEQQKFMLVAREIFCTSYQKVNMERAQLGVELQASERPPEAFNSYCGDPECDDNTEELLDKVLRTLRKQSSLTIVVTSFLFEKIFTPLQGARCALHAHPLLPAGHIILNAVAAELALKQPAKMAASFTARH